MCEKKKIMPRKPGVTFMEKQKPPPEYRAAECVR
jgi:hypothetical protein